jgi:hypothetical protein
MKNAREHVCPYSDGDDDSRHDCRAGGSSSRKTVGGVKGVIIGHWRDSPVPEESRKHAVLGFIDARDRLRARIQPTNLLGEQISREYALPPGPGGSCVAFERIVFLSHLVGLDHSQVKEYVRLRNDTPPETPEQQAAAEKQAAEDVVARVKKSFSNAPTQASVAYGLNVPICVASRTTRSSAKRSLFKPASQQDQQSRPAAPAADTQATSSSRPPEQPSFLHGYELRTSRRKQAELMAQEAQAQQKVTRKQPTSAKNRSNCRSRRGTGSRGRGPESTNALAQQAISRAEATQNRADLYVSLQKRATAAAVLEAGATSAAPVLPGVNSTSSSNFVSPGEIVNLDSSYARASARDTKIYDGQVYNRKLTGPFVRKLATHGSLISIDGEDYIEYRVLLKPAF